MKSINVINPMPLLIFNLDGVHKFFLSKNNQYLLSIGKLGDENIKIWDCNSRKCKHIIEQAHKSK